MNALGKYLVELLSSSILVENGSLCRAHHIIGSVHLANLLPARTQCQVVVGTITDQYGADQGMGES